MEKLVRRAQRGDRDAFVRLIEEHKLSMTRTALAVLHDEEDAADAIGETVLIAFAKLHTLREPKYFKTWLTRVLLYNCFGILRLRQGLAPLDQLPEGEAPNRTGTWRWTWERPSRPWRKTTGWCSPSTTWTTCR